MVALLQGTEAVVWVRPVILLLLVPKVAELPTKVLLDTNFLLVPIRFGVDIFTEAERALNQLVELTVSTGVLREMEALKEEAGPKFPVTAAVG